WLQPIVDTFWEVSYATVVESQVARLNGGVWALDTVNFAEAVYFYSGECTGGGGGDCAPGDITTFFGGGNQFAGNMFDVTASGGDDVLIEGFDINMDPGSGLISVYYKSGSYVGFESNAGAWTLLGSETVNSAGTNNPTPLNVGGLVIPAGETYGIYVTSTDYTSNNFAMNYTNGDNVFSDAYVTIQTGVGKGNPDFTGTTFQSRSWNGTIYYCAGEGGGGGDCVEENLSEAFLGGYTTSMDQSQRIAADITVPADVDFVLNRITANIWVNAGGNVTACEVKIYADAGGLPDTSNVIDTQSVVPTSFDQIGTQGGFAIHEMILDISSVTLPGQAGNTTSYWIQLAVTSTGGSGFWDFD